MLEILDMSDPYDAHAFFICSFSCDDCGDYLLPDDGFEGCDDESCRHISDKANTLRWYVPAADQEGRMDIETCFCPQCAAKKGLR